MIELRIKMFNRQFDCYGTIAGYDWYELSNNKQEAVDMMIERCNKFAPGIPYKIIDETVPAPEIGNNMHHNVEENGNHLFRLSDSEGALIITLLADFSQIQFVKTDADGYEDGSCYLNTNSSELKWLYTIIGNALNTNTCEEGGTI